MIQTPTNPEGKIKDNSVLKMLENSLSDGALYSFRNPQTGEGDEDAMLCVLKDFWSAVRHVFPEAWDKPPRQSRLMHGVGIVSLGFLMDAIFDRYIRVRIPVKEILQETWPRWRPSAAGQPVSGISVRMISVSGTNFRTPPATSRYSANTSSTNTKLESGALPSMKERLVKRPGRRGGNPGWVKRSPLVGR